MASPAVASLRPADRDLALSSAAAVRGRVAAIRAVHDPVVDAIYTLVAIDVDRAWGLDGTPARVVVKQLGGVLNDTALLVGGQARFSPGEDVLVFLEVRPRDRTLSVAGFEQGKWLAVDAGAAGRAGAARDLHGLDTRAGATRETQALVDVEALAALAGTRVHAGALDLDAGMAAAVAGDTLPTADAAGRPAFTLLAPYAPARWHQADSSTPVAVDAQTGGDPHLAGGGLQEVMAGLSAWSGVARLQLRPGTFRGPRCFAHAEAADGRISITYGDPCGEIADSSLTLAIGGAYFSAADTRVVNGVRFWKITAGMIVLDDVPEKFTGLGRGCYADLVAHEIGHAIGLGHATSRPALMYPTLAPECANRAAGLPPQPDDVAGATLLYPRSTAPLPGIPNGLGAAVIGDTVRVFWGRPAWGQTPTGYRLEVGSGPGLGDRGIAVLERTELVASSVPNGVYHVRVRALAGDAVGISTPDILLEVGGPPPGAPEQVVAVAGSGGVVNVSWQPPATGTVTKYVVQVGYAPGQVVHQFPVSQLAIGAHGVPPGTYHVRVVAMNGTSAGPPSAGIVLVVP